MECDVRAGGGTTILLATVLLAGPACGQQSESNRQQPSDQQQELVAPGDVSLEPDGVEGHSAVWRLTGADGEEMGVASREVDRIVHLPGEPAITVFYHLRFPQRSALDVTYLDPSTLLPFARYVTGQGGLWIHYQSGERLVASYTRREGGEPQSIEAPLRPGRFNGGVVDLVLASLPLEEGLTAVLPLLGASGQPTDLTETMSAEVTDRQMLSLPDGTRVDTWRVLLRRSSGATQAMYISRRAPHMILREILDDSGEVVQRWQLIEWSLKTP